LNTVLNVGCSLQILETLLEAVDFQNWNQVVPGRLVSISLYLEDDRARPQAFVGLYHAQEPRQAYSPECACLGISALHQARLSASTHVHRQARDGTTMPSTWGWWMGEFIPLLPPPWGRSTLVAPRLHPGLLQAAPAGETPFSWGQSPLEGLDLAGRCPDAVRTQKRIDLALFCNWMLLVLGFRRCPRCAIGLHYCYSYSTF
jgi:hypothetical protein